MDLCDKLLSFDFVKILGHSLLVYVVGVFLTGMVISLGYIIEINSDSLQMMLKSNSASVSLKGISSESSEQLRSDNIWALYLDLDGNIAWGVDVPKEIPERFTIQDVPIFANGYLADCPVFIKNTDDGMLILGYPQHSYVKLYRNYCSWVSTKGVLIAVIWIFLVMWEMLMRTWKSVTREYGIAHMKDRARANWIKSISHDIRTPLSLIMGYSDMLADNCEIGDSARKEANIILEESKWIRDLVNDLKLVSQLEYEMQPINKGPVCLSMLLRTCAVGLLNEGLSNRFSIETEIMADAETITFDCDEQLIKRAVKNLLYNSVLHNPDGCDIILGLNCTAETVVITVSDNGVGLSIEKMKALKEKPHDQESADARLDLGHGLGLYLVHQIAKAHNGTMRIKSGYQTGFCVELILKIQDDNRAINEQKHKLYELMGIFALTEPYEL